MPVHLPDLGLFVAPIHEGMVRLSGSGWSVTWMRLRLSVATWRAYTCMEQVVETNAPLLSQGATLKTKSGRNTV